MSRLFKRERSAAAPGMIEVDWNQCEEQVMDLFDELLQQDHHGEEKHEHTCNPALPCPHSHSHSHPEPMVDEADEEEEDHPGCKCSKIDCLKLYCECFAKGRKCNRRCVCVGCKNHPGNEEVIYRAQQVANHRNPGHFKGVPAWVPGRRCTCKKSNCRKNYCECFRAGVPCGPECECVGCCNGKPHSHHNHPTQYDGAFLLTAPQPKPVYTLAG